MSDAPEIPLSGGNSAVVVRVGDTVRRTLNPNSPAIHALLRHLEAQGFASAPRLLGIDAQGREMLTYFEGTAGVGSDTWTDAAVVAAAQLLRGYHAAVRSFVPPPDARWLMQFRDVARHELICHNDFAPYNLVFRDRRPYALLDFDAAGPGPALRDVAYGVYWFAPLSFGADLTALAEADLGAGGQRLRLFCRTYGVAPSVDLLALVDDVLNWMVERLVIGAAAGDAVCRQLIRDGHLAHWERERAAFRLRRPEVERALGL